MGRKLKWDETSKILTIRVPESKLEVIKEYINLVLENMEELGRIKGIKDILLCNRCGKIDPNYINRCICMDCLEKADKERISPLIKKHFPDKPRPKRNPFKEILERNNKTVKVNPNE